MIRQNKPPWFLQYTQHMALNAANPQLNFQMYNRDMTYTCTSKRDPGSSRSASA